MLLLLVGCKVLDRSLSRYDWTCTSSDGLHIVSIVDTGISYQAVIGDTTRMIRVDLAQDMGARRS